MQKLVATITDRDAQFCVLDIEVEGNVTRKKIKTSNFVELLNNSMSEDMRGIRIGKMPFGYHDGIIAENGFSAIIFIQGTIRPFQYFQEPYLIPYPNLAFLFRVKEGKVVLSRVFAVKDSILNNDTLLYHYPFANVYDNGNICWGSNKLPRVSSLVELDKLTELFFSASSNNDLWRTNYIGDIYPAFRAAIEDLNGKEYFPYFTLLPTGHTAGELL